MQKHAVSKKLNLKKHPKSQETLLKEILHLSHSLDLKKDFFTYSEQLYELSPGKETEKHDQYILKVLKKKNWTLPKTAFWQSKKSGLKISLLGFYDTANEPWNLAFGIGKVFKPSKKK